MTGFVQPTHCPTDALVQPCVYLPSVHWRQQNWPELSAKYSGLHAQAQSDAPWSDTAADMYRLCAGPFVHAWHVPSAPFWQAERYWPTAHVAEVEQGRQPVLSLFFLYPALHCHEHGG